MFHIPELYKKYFIDNCNERKDLFELIKKEFQSNKVFYPGCFVHITPSFYFQEVVYLDLDKRCKSFFSSTKTIEYINKNKKYDERPIIRFYESNFENEIDEKNEYFDLLISQYSGFISKYCTRYLKRSGLLIVNDSHGDGTYAYKSGEYDFIAVINEDMSIDFNNLDSYFSFSRKREIDLEKVIKNMKGPKYKNRAFSYIFKKR